MQTLHGYLYDSLRNQRILAILATIFSLFILAVVALGLYGSLSYAVTRRTHEIGVRMALGAQRTRVLGMVLRWGLMLGCAGIVAGTLAGLGLTRFVRSELWGISPTDAMTFSASAIFLTIVIVAACYIPARRAMRVDPVVALRHE
ncbi:MAG TPA: FtsX-like permease family protein [Candidatus Acidoferrales bacterium]|nr:FtsX-like permease family protein [Candidatus Acidoferrales bacterium]